MSRLRDMVATPGGLKAQAAPFADPILWLLLALGGVALALPAPGYMLPWHWLLGKAALEEMFFRLLLQQILLGYPLMARALGPVSAANATATAAFAAVHLMAHPPLWAALVFLPGLVFGYAWDRWRLLWPCVILHFFYNWLLFHNQTLLGLLSG